ncbi:uncharacterized protein ASCRUDRAFT_105719 [Ascoidea rubescens DSM 1968]|uniref:Uncharacterized protein n=1 Tax=Ascoidea rubescens DSM 1968 TaxID=1344418 RepID=A0A1D2VSB4_9ASCO|nr:hypothetical protein ASCRUDRAFT_105719 [Ascoidea rubescens DSM 1968]ODV64496.1 hypothetical protein ASCRUDRAFT_105719 [Ascoidea rubescens DSM 1968]
MAKLSMLKNRLNSQKKISNLFCASASSAENRTNFRKFAPGQKKIGNTKCETLYYILLAVLIRSKNIISLSSITCESPIAMLEKGK